MANADRPGGYRLGADYVSAFDLMRAAPRCGAESGAGHRAWRPPCRTAGAECMRVECGNCSSPRLRAPEQDVGDSRCAKHGIGERLRFELA